MDLSAIFCLDRKREKRYHKPQVNHYCDEEEEYLRSICRELSVGARQRCETEKGTLEQCHKRGLMRRHQSTRVEPRSESFVPWLADGFLFFSASRRGRANKKSAGEG